MVEIDINRTEKSKTLFVVTHFICLVIVLTTPLASPAPSMLNVSVPQLFGEELLNVRPRIQLRHPSLLPLIFYRVLAHIVERVLHTTLLAYYRVQRALMDFVTIQAVARYYVAFLLTQGVRNGRWLWLFWFNQLALARAVDVGIEGEIRERAL